MGGNTNSTKDQKSEKQVLREQKRTIDRAARKVEREITKLQQQETKALKEVQNLAKKGQHGPAKTVAKTVANIRSQVKNNY